VGGLLEIIKESQPKIFIHRFDAGYLWKFGEIVELNEGDNIETETMPLRVIHTPGHTIGSICLHNQKNKILFSGDTVFPDGVFGRVDLTSSTGLKDMINSLKKLSMLDTEILLPGHEDPVYSNANIHIKAALKVAEEYQ
jgi:glyoxylase-like metal-dependent hydrolase (beta-lactamase superfamily II)